MLIPNKLEVPTTGNDPETSPTESRKTGREAFGVFLGFSAGYGIR
jgi:hypothetical protein